MRKCKRRVATHRRAEVCDDTVRQLDYNIFEHCENWIAGVARHTPIHGDT